MQIVDEVELRHKGFAAVGQPWAARLSPHWNPSTYVSDVVGPIQRSPQPDGHPMAVVTRRHGKTLRRMRRKPKVQRTKPVLKWGKAPARARRWKAAPKGLNGWFQKGSDSWYISRLLNQLSPAARRMSVEAKRLINISMGSLCKGLITEADRWRRQRRGSFIGTSELRAAVDKVMKGEVYFGSSTSSRSSYGN